MKELGDQVVEELLKEHARHNGNVDDDFLKELESKIDMLEAGQAELPVTKPRVWQPWVGLAAAVVIGGLTFYVYDRNKPEGEVIADYEVTSDFELPQDETALASRENKVGKGAPKRKQPFTRKPPPPSSSMTKVIASSPASEKPVAVPALEVSEEIIDFRGFGGSADVGDAFVGRSEMKRPKAKGYEDNRRLQQGRTSIENRFQNPSLETQKFSTFAVDVDTASYANVRRMIQTGIKIDPSAVRLEEMVNYFDYTYAQPTGKHPFSVHTEIASSPWNEKHRLVRIGIQGKDIVREERPATNLVFLLDVSGSMSSTDKLPLLKQSMAYLLEALNSEDTVSIVVYSGAEGVALEPTKASELGKEKILEAMSQLSSGGSTAGGAGIKLAYSIAKQNFVQGGVNRIILGTDGDFNVGVSDTGELTRLVKQEAKLGTYLSVLGVGQGNLNDAMLESITNNGNGNYFYIDSLKEGRKVLLEDMMGTVVTIAKDVKVQVAFNPKQVKAYRLLGYSNRMLKAEDFRDKKIDAGEIGAGHSVTAFYEVIPADGSAFGPQIDLSPFEDKKEESASAKTGLKELEEMMFVKLAYKTPEAMENDESIYLQIGAKDNGADWEESSEDFKFSSSVALSSMLLRQSQYVGDGNWALARQLAREGKGDDEEALRQEFIHLIELVSK